MNIKSEVNKIGLRLGFDQGIKDGKQKIRSKSISKIRKDVEDENLYLSALALGSLVREDLLKVVRVEEKEIMGE